MINRRELLAAAGLTVLAGVPAADARRKNGVNGRVFTVGDVPVRGARVSITSEDLSFFRETRTNKKGRYAFPRVPVGNHHLAVSARGYQYRVLIVSLSGGVNHEDVGLAPESEGGRWSTLGPLDAALTGGSLSGTLLPNGRVLLTSDGLAGQIVNPLTGAMTPIAPAASPQSGHAAALLPNGHVLLVGGGELQGDGTATAGTTVRAYDPVQNSWTDWAGLTEPRWRPTVVRLVDGRFLVIGGFGALGEPLATCEVLDPSTGTATPTGSLPGACGLAVAAPLENGKVLCTWGTPQLYDPATGEWRPAAPFTQPNRGELESCPTGNPPLEGKTPQPTDRPDHLLAPLPGGVAAVGTRRTANFDETAMTEAYDPRRNAWTRNGGPRTLRSGCLALTLPDARVLVAGGRQEDPNTAENVDAWCQVPRTDLFDPVLGNWRRVEDMPEARSARGVSVLLPDGRVLIAGGVGDPSPGAPAGAEGAIHVFEPPYLFRGPRPVITGLSTGQLKRGASFTVTVVNGKQVSDLVLISPRACSGWSDGGGQRFARLRFKTQKGKIRAVVPKKPELLPPGPYLLFAMVDDVPSEARMVYVS